VFPLGGFSWRDLDSQFPEWIPWFGQVFMIFLLVPFFVACEHAARPFPARFSHLDFDFLLVPRGGVSSSARSALCLFPLWKRPVRNHETSWSAPSCSLAMVCCSVTATRSSRKDLPRPGRRLACCSFPAGCFVCSPILICLGASVFASRIQLCSLKDFISRLSTRAAVVRALENAACSARSSIFFFCHLFRARAIAAKVAVCF
jgi:hypothetical protein